MPPGIDWQTWRIVVNERFSDTLDTIQNRWSLRDIVDANLLLDTLEAAQAEASKPKDRPRK